MIDDVSEYRLVTVPDGIRIDGGIMPARDVADDGSWKILRGEDPCFLAEAGARISAYTFSLSGLGQVTRKVDSGQILNARNAIVHGSWDGRVWPNVPVLQNPITYGMAYVRDVVQSYGGSITDKVAVVDACLTSGTKSVPASWASSGSSLWHTPLLADDIRRIFYDLDHVKGIPSGGLGTTAAAGGTYRYRDWIQPPYGLDRDVTRPYPDDTNPRRDWSVISLVNTTVSGPVYAARQYDYTWSITELVTTTNNDIRAKLVRLSPTTCWLFFIVHTLYEKYFSPSPVFEEHYDACVIPGTIIPNGESAGNISCSLSSADVLANAVSGRTLYTDVWDMPDDRLEKIDVSYVGTMFYDAEIDFSDLGWVWTPAP